MRTVPLVPNVSAAERGGAILFYFPMLCYDFLLITMCRACSELSPVTNCRRNRFGTINEQS